MKTITTKVYDVRKLKRYRPEGFKRAYETYCQNVAEDTYSMNEIMDSLKALFKAAGVKMSDWEIGAYSHSHLSAQFGREDYGDGPGELEGARALAWIENNLLEQFRAPFGLNKEDGNLHLNGDNGKRGKHYRKRWARWYAPGSVKSCPLTGVCYDEDFIEALTKSVKEGETLREAFEGLADVARKLIEGEDEYAREESSFIEAAEANGWEWTAEGKMV